jgi:hypothetical protein
VNDPINLLSEDHAKINVRKNALTGLKCKGSDIHHYAQRFEYLVKQAELPDDREKQYVYGRVQ